MLRKIIFTLLLSTFVFASENPVYSSSQNTMFGHIFSGKQTKLMRDLFVKFDLGSALVMLDHRLVNDVTRNSPKRLNPDKTLLTLSYRF